MKSPHHEGALGLQWDQRATGGITMYPTGTGSGLLLESDLSSFDADKEPYQRFGEWGDAGHQQVALLSLLQVAQPGHTKQP